MSFLISRQLPFVAAPILFKIPRGMVRVVSPLPTGSDPPSPEAASYVVVVSPLPPLVIPLSSEVRPCVVVASPIQSMVIFFPL